MRVSLTRFSLNAIQFQHPLKKLSDSNPNKLLLCISFN